MSNINPFTGEKYRKPQTEAVILAKLSNPTPKEMIVLRLISEGKSNSEIAQIMVVSQRTAESHVSNLLNKTFCKSRLELVIHFIQKGLLAPIGTAERISYLEQQVVTLEKQRDQAIGHLKKIKTIFRQSTANILEQLDTQDFT